MTGRPCVCVHCDDVCLVPDRSGREYALPPAAICDDCDAAVARSLDESYSDRELECHPGARRPWPPEED